MSTPRAQHATLSAILRRLRHEAGLSQIQVAEATGLSQAKISRLEKGKFTPHVEDVRRLGRAFRASATEQRELERIAQDLTDGQVYTRIILQRGGWEMQQKAGRLEQASTRVRAFHPILVPGLLQTETYARTMFASGLTGSDLDRTVESRMVRQALFDSDREFGFVLTEGALRWQVGGPAVMIEQLQHIDRVTRIPNVRVGIIDWATQVDVYPVDGFDLYDTFAVITGTFTATATITDEHDIADYDKHFGQLEAVASFDGRARAILRRVIGDYRRLMR